MARTLPPFDPARDFVCIRDFDAAGVSWTKGLPFDKSKVSPRILRRLYDHRRIGYPGVKYVHHFPPRPPKAAKPAPAPKAPPAPAPPAPPAPGSPERDGPSVEDQIAALVDKFSHKQLTQKAEGLEGLPARPNKTDLATAIVKAGNGAA